MSYADFLAKKTRLTVPDGAAVEWDDMHPSLFPHQRHVVRWTADRGRASVFLDTGLGKTRIAVEWARHIGQRTLILAPLSVARQTVREAAAIDAEVRYVRHQDEVTGPGIWITNYEMEQAFDPRCWDAVVADESSILKNHTGAMRGALIKRWATVPYRLACTATPAPNDTTELANHAEFCGAMSRVEMLAAFFVHDDEGWRPKGHAVEPMYRWMTTWATAARRPSDLGPFDDSPYVLPPLRIHGEIVESHEAPEGQLFSTGIGGIGGRSRVRKATMNDRLERDGCAVRPALADYVLLFRVPGDNAEPVKPEVTRDEWIAWARPIWTGIRETNTLNTAIAKSEQDERHICPLQLDLIERCVRLWSNRGETVLTPFLGIGSEAFVAIQHGRRAVGIELKPSYFNVAVDNLRRAEREANEPSLLDELEAEPATR